MSVAESRHQIAIEIAKRYTREGTGYGDRLYGLTYAIKAALKDERERVAKMMAVGSDGVGGDWGCNEAAAAIRNEDTNA